MITSQRRNPAARAVSLVGLVALVLTAGIVVASPARAAVQAVDSTADAPDAVPGDGACATGGGDCTLRAAIEEANATPGGDAVVLPSGTYTLGLGELLVSRNLSIVGTSDDPGTGADERPVVDAGGGSRVFRVDGVGDTSIEVRISDAVIKGGDAGAGDGGGILNLAADLTLRDVRLSDNRADDGGGIFNDRGALDLSRVVLNTNLASGRGGMGDDVLRGGGGRDRLRGGPGTDACRGGPGRDRLTGCER